MGRGEIVSRDDGAEDSTSDESSSYCPDDSDSSSDDASYSLSSSVSGDYGYSARSEINSSSTGKKLLGAIVIMVAYCMTPLTMAAVVEHWQIDTHLGIVSITCYEMRGTAFLIFWPLFVVLAALPAAVDAILWWLTGTPPGNTLFEMVALPSVLLWLLSARLAYFGIGRI